ncbi:MAG: hypothetical protein AAF442_04820 [Pseudomonadota bacterium]
MRVFLSTVFLLSVFAAVLAVNMLGNEINDRQAQLAKLQDHITDQRDAMRVLQADWALLTSPQHLQKLVTQHLNLVAVHAQTVGGTVAALHVPLPPPALPRTMIALSDG